MKRIILGILVLLVCVSMVSGYLGSELVDCGSFDCDECLFTCSDFWIGDINDGTNDWGINAPEGGMAVIFSFSPRKAELNQTINIKSNTQYTISLNLFPDTLNNAHLEVWLGNRLFGNVTSTDSQSFTNTTIDTSDLKIIGVQGSGFSSAEIQDVSVKEIIPPITEYEIDIWVRKDGNIIREYHQENWVEKQVAQLIRILDRLFRFKK